MKYSAVKRPVYAREFSMEMGSDEKQKKFIARGSDVFGLLLTLCVLTLGASVFAVGVWLLTQPLVSQLGPSFVGSIWYAGDPHPLKMSYMELIGIFGAVDGGMIFLLMVLATIGITSSNHTAQCYIGTYLISLIISFAFCVTLFIRGFPAGWSEESAVSYFREQLVERYEGPEGDSHFTTAFNQLQISSECCGVSDPEEIRGPEALNFTAWFNATYPLPEPCDTADEGCMNELMKRGSLFHVLLLALALSCLGLQIPALLNALCLCSAS